MGSLQIISSIVYSIITLREVEGLQFCNLHWRVCDICWKPWKILLLYILPGEIAAALGWVLPQLVVVFSPLSDPRLSLL